MRAFAHAAGLVCLLSCLSAANCSADISSSWKQLGQARFEQARPTGTLEFRPELSLAENNRRIAEHRANTASAIATVPLAEVAGQNLINRPARAVFDGQTYNGRVTAVMVSPSREAVLFVQLDTRPAFGRSTPIDGRTGPLSIQY